MAEFIYNTLCNTILGLFGFYLGRLSMKRRLET